MKRRILTMVVALISGGVLTLVWPGALAPASATCGSAAQSNTQVGAEGSRFTALAQGKDPGSCSGPAPGVAVPPGSRHTRDACDLGGAETCSQVATCPDGSVEQETYYQTIDGQILDDHRFCPTDNPPGPTPAAIYTAFKTIPLPTPQLHIQPTGNHTLVNLPTIYYTNPTTINTTLTVLDATVTFHITTTYTWHYGDHTTAATTTNPGAPYPHQTNTHTYHHPGTLHPTLDATYHADYRINHHPWQHLTPTITTTSPPHTLTIHTATPHLTGR
jgi:hypothetical protein